MAQLEGYADFLREGLRGQSQALMETVPRLRRLRGHLALAELRVALKQGLTQREEVLVT